MKTHNFSLLELSYLVCVIMLYTTHTIGPSEAAVLERWCLPAGVDISGQDQAKTVWQNVDSCAELCSNSITCDFFVMGKPPLDAHGTCVQKSGAFNGSNGASGLSSWVDVTCFLHYQRPYFELPRGQDVAGSSLQVVNSTNSTVCKEACTANELCEYIVLDESACTLYRDAFQGSERSNARAQGTFTVLLYTGTRDATSTLLDAPSAVQNVREQSLTDITTASSLKFSSAFDVDSHAKSSRPGLLLLLSLLWIVTMYLL